MDINYRKITKKDAETYWELRLSALKNSPDAFASSYEEQKDRPMDEIAKRINVADDNFIFAAFDGMKAIGMVGFQREITAKLNHKAFIWGVYLYPEFRGQGIARKLMEEVIANARKLEGLRQIRLEVAAHNDKAKKLYIGLGFETFGIEKDALYVDGKYKSEEYMVKFL
jgi:ribosomal protein S18 acetylase RimI-like enzyme